MIPTILIVDDEPDLREAIAFDFRRKKFNVLTASCGNEAMKIVENQRIDVVLSDVRMPNGDGVDLLDRIKARNAFLPVVMFITGFADITLEEAYDKGADAVFAKPFDRKVLLDAVQRAIQPSEQRLLRKTSRVGIDLPIGLRFLNGNASAQARVQNLGRGGIFVTMNGAFPSLQQEVEFRIDSATDSNLVISGTGIVRWVRPEPVDQFPAGCGIEFTNLEKECLRRVVDLINFLKTKSYIPRS